MMTEISYAAEKFTVALSTLSCSRQDLRTRIYNAFLKFHTVEPKKLPEDLGEKLQEIYDSLNNVKSIIIPDEGTVKTTLSSMSDDEAEEISGKILEMFFEIQYVKTNRDRNN